MVDEYDARRFAYEAAQAALGPLRFRDERRAEAHVDGRVVLVTFRDAMKTRRRGAGMRRLPFRITQISVPLARALPLVFMVENRRVYVHAGSTPEVRTGDPAFDREYFVFGSPPEVVAAAMDADVRGWVRTMGANPALGLEDSLVSSTWGTPGLAARTAPEDLLQAARAQVHIADAIVRAYDARYAQLRAESGPEAADAWHAAAAHQIEKRARDRTRLRLIVLAVLGVVAAAVIGLILLIVFLASFAGC